MKLRERTETIVIGLLNFGAVVSLALVIGTAAAAVVWALSRAGALR